ncbi:LamG-like jellyroll fold domain-containing protein [Spirosoma sp. SC4-14]|uniref:LamG-like jellyroll fold domain-containing protein n=1 Tax=Spirosoma sp. SC4-14 TaxID=3128900 RepID=UPI0030D3E5D0
MTTKISTTYLWGLLFIGLSALLLGACDPWELPTKKNKRNCTSPTGTLEAQTQQLKVNFSIGSATGTIDNVQWDFGTNSTTVTTGTTVSYTYPTSGTYTAKATLSNSCEESITLSRTIIVNTATLPTVTLQPITNIMPTSADAQMTITTNGNATISRYGICYSPTSTTPKIGESDVYTIEKTDAVALNTSIPFSLTGLQANTMYYVRSYAVNSSGSGYSTTVQTFRSGENPSIAINGNATAGVTTATVNFIVSKAGTPAAVEYGILYSSTTSTPDMSNSGPGIIVTAPNIGVNIPVNLTALTPNTTYYYRPYAKLPNGTIVPGPVGSFTTLVDPVADGLIAYLPFTNKSLQDASGNGNHANGVNNPTFTTDHRGVANAAILFDGQSNYIYLAENSSLRPQALSISVWIKPITVDRKMQIYNKSNFTDSKNEMYSSTIKPSDNQPGSITILTDIKQNSGCQPVTGWQSFPLTSQLDLTSWHHIVFTYVGHSARMYYDGALLYTKDDLPASTMDNCPGGDLRFGAQLKDYPQYFYGAMDEIRIYNRALSQDEVKTLFNQ